MSKTKSALKRMQNIYRGKVLYVIHCDGVEVFSSNKFFDTIQYLDSVQLQHPSLEYKITVKEL